MDEILIGRYPELEGVKDKTINNCIDEYPYLAKYINKHKDDFLLPQKNTILEKAKSEFQDEKENIKNRFIKMLADNHIDTVKFRDNINKLSDICNRELAQYFFYRQNIINALNKLNNENNKKEELLHNLFMTKGTISDKKNDENSIYNTNIWLLDDKFMSYFTMFSDKSIKKIKEYLQKSKISGSSLKEPDITIFYNENNGNKDVVVIELKAIGAKTDNKMFSITEINRNLGILAEEIDGLKTLYGYIITNLDDDTKKELRAQNGVRELFAVGHSPIYYYYNENIRDKAGNLKPCHVYILSTDTLYEDANARNKIFLDIIKNN